MQCCTVGYAAHNSGLILPIKTYSKMYFIHCKYHMQSKVKLALSGLVNNMGGHLHLLGRSESYISTCATELASPQMFIRSGRKSLHESSNGSECHVKREEHAGESLHRGPASLTVCKHPCVPWVTLRGQTSKHFHTTMVGKTHWTGLKWQVNLPYEIGLGGKCINIVIHRKGCQKWPCS